MPPGSMRLGIAGLGAIGTELAARLRQEDLGVELVAVAARDRGKAERTLRSLGAHDVPVVELEELPVRCDVVVECAARAVLEKLAEPVLRAGKELIVLSAGALLDHPDWVELAAANGGRITVPTGAIAGLDAVSAAAVAGIDSVRLTTRKPLAGLRGASELERRGMELDGLDEPLRVFSGSAREAASGFPANLNIAVALALAGVGPDRTEVEVWADPEVTHNTHSVELRSDVANLTLTIQNVPSDNPRTGRITALSVVSLLRKRAAPLSIGS